MCLITARQHTQTLAGGGVEHAPRQMLPELVPGCRAAPHSPTLILSPALPMGLPSEARPSTRCLQGSREAAQAAQPAASMPRLPPRRRHKVAIRKPLGSPLAGRCAAALTARGRPRGGSRPASAPGRPRRRAAAGARRSPAPPAAQRKARGAGAARRPGVGACKRRLVGGPARTPGGLRATPASNPNRVTRAPLLRFFPSVPTWASG